MRPPATNLIRYRISSSIPFLALLLALTGASLSFLSNAQETPSAAQPADSEEGGSADARPPRFSGDPDELTQTDGEALYQTTCQACHMEDGSGASGAGAYPPLRDNPKLLSRHFLAGVILTGYHGMPRFDQMMSDEQVAAVTNYIRSHFGNEYSDEITAEEVARLRPPELKED